VFLPNSGGMPIEHQRTGRGTRPRPNQQHTKQQHTQLGQRAKCVTPVTNEDQVPGPLCDQHPTAPAINTGHQTATDGY